MMWVALTASVKIAAVPVLPAGSRFARSWSSSFTRSTNGADWISFGATAVPET
jgi:hypothetical protein